MDIPFRLKGETAEWREFAIKGIRPRDGARLSQKPAAIMVYGAQEHYSSCTATHLRALGKTPPIIALICSTAHCAMQEPASCSTVTGLHADYPPFSLPPKIMKDFA